MGVPDEEQVVRPTRRSWPAAAATHRRGSPGPRPPRSPDTAGPASPVREVPGVPDDAAPLGLAAPEQSLDVLLEDVPDFLPLESAQRPSPSDPGHLEVVGSGLDLVGLDDLFPLLSEEAGVELHARLTDGSPPPSRRPVRRDWRPRPSAPELAGIERPRRAGGRPRSGPSRAAEVGEVLFDILGEGRRVGREQDAAPAARSTESAPDAGPGASPRPSCPSRLLR